MARGPDEVVVELLSPYLGPHTARTALRTFSQRAVGVTPDKLTVASALEVMAALRPMLSGLLGATVASELVTRCSAELAR